MYRSSRKVICSAWRQLTATGSLRFPDAVQERRFVQHAGEHGLSVMRFVLLLTLSPGHNHRASPCTSFRQAVSAKMAVGKLCHADDALASRYAA